MQLIKINKTRYRRHLNRVIFACIASLIAGSLVISQTLIAFFPNPTGSHFHWNFLGVVASAIAIALTLNKYRTHDFMTEVTYVWDLKQALNRISRRMLRLKPAAQQGNANAMLALQFSYAGSRLLWELDDNTIVMDQLVIEQAELDSLVARYNLALNINDYNESILNEF
jgi:hypothetical protein